MVLRMLRIALPLSVLVSFQVAEPQAGSGSAGFAFDPVNGNGLPMGTNYATMGNNRIDTCNAGFNANPWTCNSGTQVGITCGSRFCRALGYQGGEVAECFPPPGAPCGPPYGACTGGGVDVYCY